MATFKYQYDSPGYPPDFGGSGVFRRKVDVPSLIANGGLSDTSDVAATLASTGFATSDVLQVFQVPKGFCLTHVAVDVTTANTATADIDIGCLTASQTLGGGSSADDFMGTCALQTATWKQNLIGDTLLGGSTYESVIYITDGSIDITFNTAAALQVIFIVCCAGYRYLREDQS